MPNEAATWVPPSAIHPEPAPIPSAPKAEPMTAREWLVVNDECWINSIASGAPTTSQAVEAAMEAYARHCVEHATKELLRERDGWEEDARQRELNTRYYRGLLVRIGEKFGAPAYISDDGSVQQDVLCAKVPELVEGLRQEIEQLRLEKQQKQMVIDGYRADLQRAEAERDTLREAFNAANPARNKWNMLCNKFGYVPEKSCVATISDRLEAAERDLTAALTALEPLVWQDRFACPDDPYCVLCGAGKAWAAKHGHQLTCALYNFTPPAGDDGGEKES